MVGNTFEMERVTAFAYLKQHQPYTLWLHSEPRDALIADNARATKYVKEVRDMKAVWLMVIETEGPLAGEPVPAFSPLVWAHIYQD